MQILHIACEFCIGSISQNWVAVQDSISVFESLKVIFITPLFSLLIFSLMQTSMLDVWYIVYTVRLPHLTDFQ